MRNGDYYKMEKMFAIGTPREEIYERFGAQYSKEEIDFFFPAEPLKKLHRRKKGSKDDVAGVNLQHGATVAGSE